MSSCSQRGSTLLLVTWMLAVIGIMVTFLLYRAEIEWLAVSNLDRNLKYRETAEEILRSRLVLLALDDTPSDNCKDPWFGETGKIEEDWGSYRVTVLIEDEGSKPNLNFTGEEALKTLLGDKASPDPILDWRDPDSEQRAEGAELAYYQEQNPPFKPRDGFFSSVEEVKCLKNGDKLYPEIAPVFTVFGKVNPNAISAESFGEILRCNGFEKNFIERATAEFANFRSGSRFTKMDDFLKLGSVTIATRDKLKPLFWFQGNCNLNFVSKSGLKVFLKVIGYAPEMADSLITRRDDQPYEKGSDFVSAFRPRGQANTFSIEDYFTTVSTIIRFRIWVVKGSSQCYLETVQERVPTTMGKRKWKVHPLTWRYLFNKEVPEIPKEEPKPEPSSGGEK
jgi:type II secretory pathway component PulK